MQYQSRLKFNISTTEVVVFAAVLAMTLPLVFIAIGHVAPEAYQNVVDRCIGEIAIQTGDVSVLGRLEGGDNIPCATSGKTAGAIYSVCAILFPLGIFIAIASEALRSRFLAIGDEGRARSYSGLSVYSLYGLAAIGVVFIIASIGFATA